MPLKETTLLFVEDDIDTQKNFKMLFADDTKEFHQAFDGKEGFMLYKTIKPDIIITDINMPHINGMELLAKIKADNHNQVIIIVSAFDDKENLLNAINTGADAFITKPIDVALLFEKLKDITLKIEHKKQKEKENRQKIHYLHRLAHFDTITGIANKIVFDTELQEAVLQAKNKKTNLALFFIDLDNFKKVNDTYGHEAGDYVLKSVAQSISSIISGTDLLARRSGDEFLLLVREYPSTEFLEKLASNILYKVSKEILWIGKSISISCSIGIGRFPVDSQNIEELKILADKAMYNAKSSGKSAYFFVNSTLRFNLKRGKSANIVIINNNAYWDIKHTKLVWFSTSIVLTKNQTIFLSLLFSSTNHTFTNEQIYMEIWGYDSHDKYTNLRTMIKELRKKLPQNIIKNIFGIGYKIKMDH